MHGSMGPCRRGMTLLHATLTLPGLSMPPAPVQHNTNHHHAAHRHRGRVLKSLGRGRHAWRTA